MSITNIQASVGFALDGAAFAVVLRALYDVVLSWSRIPSKKVVILKIIFTTSLAAMIFVLSVMQTPITGGCVALGTVCLAFNHISIISADWILLSRATTVLLFRPKFAKIMEYTFVVLRIGTGVADIFLSGAIDSPSGVQCIYHQDVRSQLSGLIIDLVVDSYVTAAITLYLIVRSTTPEWKPNGLFSAIVSSNLLRSALVLVVGISMSFVLAVPSVKPWTYIAFRCHNLVYLFTIAYDSDILRLMVKMQDKISQQKHSPELPADLDTVI